MMIRQDFSQLPPKLFLMQIIDNVSRIYIFLWGKKDNLNKIFMNWDDLSHYYNKNCFRTSLRKLNNSGLLSYEETEKGISIELVGWDEVET